MSKFAEKSKHTESILLKMVLVSLDTYPWQVHGVEGTIIQTHKFMNN